VYLHVQIHELRSKTDTLTELQAQLKKTLDGAPSSATTMASSSGVKDKFHQFFFDQLQETVCWFGDPEKEITPHEKNAGMKVTLAHIQSQMPAANNIFNPALSLDGKHLIH
jgi:hypothetical protein